MRVGFRNRWGYSFKNSYIPLEQQTILRANLMRLCSINGHPGELHQYPYDSVEKDNSTIHYLRKDVNIIFGIGPPPEPTSHGIVWARINTRRELQSSAIVRAERAVLEALWYTRLANEFYPYNIKPGMRYYVQDGEVYEMPSERFNREASVV